MFTHLLPEFLEHVSSHVLQRFTNMLDIGSHLQRKLLCVFTH